MTDLADYQGLGDAGEGDRHRAAAGAGLATRAERVAEARRLRAQGLLLKQIAAEMGVNFRTVDEWLHHPDGRPERKRAYDERQRHRCALCGKRGIWGQSSLCVSCRLEEQQAKRREIEHLWNQGRSLTEIAAVVDMSQSVLGSTITKMRRSGEWNVPHRHQVGDLTRRLAALERARKVASANRRARSTASTPRPSTTETQGGASRPHHPKTPNHPSP